MAGPFLVLEVAIILSKNQLNYTSTLQFYIIVPIAIGNTNEIDYLQENKYAKESCYRRRNE